MSKLVMNNAGCFEYFGSITHFLDTARSRKARTRLKQSRKGGAERAKWAGTESMAEADRLIEYGWPDGVSQIESAMEAMASGTESIAVQTAEMDIVGPIAITGAFCAGDPECMLNPVSENEKPVVNIAVDVSQSAGTSPERIINRGAAILKVAETIVQSGREVRIVATCVQGSRLDDGKDWGACLVCVKEAGEEFNLHGLAYVLANPSFFRRHFFLWMEKTMTPDWWSQHGMSYGPPRSLRDVQDVGTVADDVDLFVNKDCGLSGDPAIAFEAVQKEAQRQGAIA